MIRLQKYKNNYAIIPRTARTQPEIHNPSWPWPAVKAHSDLGFDLFFKFLLTKPLTNGQARARCREIHYEMSYAHLGL